MIDQYKHRVFDRPIGQQQQTDDVSSYIGAYDCGCGETDLLIELFQTSAVSVGLTVCRNCGRAIAMQVRTDGYLSHRAFEKEDLEQ